MSLDDLIEGRDELLTPLELATLLKRDLRWVYDAARKGVLPKPMKVGKHLRFKRSEIETWLEAVS